MKRQIVFILALLTGVVVHASNQADLIAADLAEKAREHVFMVDKDGVCLDPPVKWGLLKQSKANPLQTRPDASLSHIDSGLKNWLATNTTPDRRVMVFVHGGMNAYSTSLERLKDTALIGALAASNCYPIFVVWDSGPFSAYWQHLFSIRQGEKWGPVAGTVTFPFFFVSDMAKGIARFPLTFFGRVRSDFKTTEAPRNFMYAKATARWEDFEALIACQPGLTNTYHPPRSEGHTRSGWDRTVRFCEYVVTLPTKTVSLPILDGMGTASWDMMLRRTRTMFEPPVFYDIAGQLGEWQTGSNAAYGSNIVARWVNRTGAKGKINAGAMYFFGKSLAQWSNDTNASARVDFEFYGHSMGTIVLNELFNRNPDIEASRIAYFGAACSIEDFEKSVCPYLRQHTNTQFYSLSLHRICERDENALSSMLPVPVFRDLIVRGSLLNWIDDIFAKPNTITDRTLGAWENATRALPDIPGDLRGQVHLRGCDIEKRPAFYRTEGLKDPQIHGAFTQANFWSTAFLWPVETNQMDLRSQ